MWILGLKGSRGRGNPYNNIVNSISILTTTILLKAFQKLYSAKTGFHHLRSLGVPPVNLKMERKLLK